jgi:hypothetical protein
MKETLISGCQQSAGEKTWGHRRKGECLQEERFKVRLKRIQVAPEGEKGTGQCSWYRKGKEVGGSAERKWVFRRKLP